MTYIYIYITMSYTAKDIGKSTYIVGGTTFYLGSSRSVTSYTVPVTRRDIEKNPPLARRIAVLK